MSRLLALQHHITRASAVKSQIGVVQLPLWRGYTQRAGAEPELFLLVDAYRRFGHYRADVNPLLTKKSQRAAPELEPQRYGIHDLDRTFSIQGILHMEEGRMRATGREIIDHLNRVYCGSIGAEVTGLNTEEETLWLTERLEKLPYESVSPEDKVRIAQDLISSETFDSFLAKRSPSTKRYGLEGAETMIPAIRSILEQATRESVKKVVIGMPHRGRLNLLANLLELPPAYIFKKVTGSSELPPTSEASGTDASGDVLSHLAQSIDLQLLPHHNPVHVSLLHNPSHLEAITPVAVGKVRAIQDRAGRRGLDRNQEAVPLLLHGDSAFAGQGVIAETFLLSYLPGFVAGGSVHMIVNNQLGFTTPSRLARSSYYCTDIAKMNAAPVLHVNGEDPETVRKVAALALEYRQAFGRDIVIDLIAYRRRGHNELDDPTLTEPTTYSEIRRRAPVGQLYRQRLIDEGVVSDDFDARGETWALLDQHWQAKANYQPPESISMAGNWRELSSTAIGTKAAEISGYDIDTLIRIGHASVTVPPTLRLDIHSRLQERHLEDRKAVLSQPTPKIDWATAEAMAFGSLLRDGYHVRLCGQDSGRGTFSQRHAEIICQETERRYVPLNHMGGEQGQLTVVNSPLSELAVLGYEYGFSIQSPWTLCIWEAQFGDFFNTAQVIVDTFITSGEDKWLRQSGLVMLLPHGYDGAGPDHSSARMERFLQAVDTDPFGGNMKETPRSVNFQVAYPTTPANYFHLLRRQIVRPYRKPLIVMAPKTVLRLPQAVSTPDEMKRSTKFQSVIPDTLPPENVRKVVFLSGKMWYELDEARTARNCTDIAFIRLEELSPFPYQRIQEELAKYAHVKDIVWVQEESKNAGAYTYVEPRMRRFMKARGSDVLSYIGRAARSAPATGIVTVHKKEKAAIFDAVFA